MGDPPSTTVPLPDGPREPRHTPERGLFPEWLDHGRYRRESKLGEGGMGIVYAYREVELDYLVAVKSIRTGFAFDAEWRRRFLEEARVLASLTHPNIARVHHFATQENVPYLVLEHIPGLALHRALEVGGRPPLDQALRLCHQVGDAIRAAHAVKLVHLDVKPRNLMVRPDETAVLMDFGLARRLRRGPRGAPGEDESRDITGGAGTPGYMAPEQAVGDAPIDERADIWAWGCVLYECLTGVAAFPGRTKTERMAATLEREPDWSRLPADVPAPIIELLESCLTKDVRHRLPDIADALDVLAEQMRATTPPPARSVAHNVPEPLTTFVPRPGELADLAVRLAAGRLLTLRGEGGCGKTRLATALARCVADRAAPGAPPFDDGVWFVELRSVASADLVSQAVASTLWGAQPRPKGRTTIEALLEELETRRALIVLDNCEGVLDGCFEFVVRMLTACPGIHFIATSRERLGVPGEQVYPVPPLAVPTEASPADPEGYPAVRLFAERARLVRPNFTVGSENVSVVAGICRRLGGIPLSIELAAARLGGISEADLAERLMEFVADEPQIEAAIQASVDALDPAGRRLLGRLAVFVDGWTLEAAEQVCGDGEGTATVQGRPVAAVLGALVERSLARHDVQGSRARYQMLETVREHCGRHLRPRGEQELRRRFVAHCLKTAQRMDRLFEGRKDEPLPAEHAYQVNPQAAWLDRMEREHNNVRQALAWTREDGADILPLAKAMSEFWRIRGDLGEGRRWLEDALSARGDVSDELQVRALNAAGTLAWIQGDTGAARRHYEDALALARATGDRPREAGILSNIGLLQRDLGDFDEAAARHDQARRVYRELGERHHAAAAELMLAGVLRIQERDAEAETLLLGCLDVFEAERDRQRVAAVLRNLGILAWRRGDGAAALDLFRRGLRVADELGDRLDTARLLDRIAVCLHAEGDLERAARLLGAAGDIRHEIGAADTVAGRDAIARVEADLAARLGAMRLRDLRQEGAALDSREVLELADPGGRRDGS